MSAEFQRNEITEEDVASLKRDIKGFNIVYDTYFERLFQYLYRRTDSEDLASELTSRTFLQALENITGYEYRGIPFSSWLYRIASNELYKYYRKTKKHQVYSIEEWRLFEVVREESEVDIEKLVANLKTYLGELKDDELNILELRFYEELEFAEIAYILDKKESAVKMRLYRCLDKLKQRFKAGGMA